MKKEEKVEIQETKTTPVQTSSVKPEVVVKEVIKEVVKEVPSTVKGIDQYTDDELLKELSDRRARRAELGAIHEVSVPIHQLMKASAVTTSDSELMQVRLQGELNHLQSKVNELGRGR